MFITIIFIVGVYVGWNIPQPQYAKTLSTKFVDWIGRTFK